MEEGYSLEDIMRGEEKEGSNLDGEEDGDEPRCALKTAGLGGEQGGGLSLKYGGSGVLPLSPTWTSADETSLDYFQG